MKKIFLSVLFLPISLDVSFFADNPQGCVIERAAEEERVKRIAESRPAQPADSLLMVAAIAASKVDTVDVGEAAGKLKLND